MISIISLRIRSVYVPAGHPYRSRCRWSHAACQSPGWAVAVRVIESVSVSKVSTPINTTKACPSDPRGMPGRRGRAPAKYRAGLILQWVVGPGARSSSIEMQTSATRVARNNSRPAQAARTVWAICKVGLVLVTWGPGAHSINLKEKKKN